MIENDVLKLFNEKVKKSEFCDEFELRRIY